MQISLFLTIFLSAGALALPNAPAVQNASLETGCGDCPWIGYYDATDAACTGKKHANTWLTTSDGEIQLFNRPAGTNVGVHFGSGIRNATSIAAYSDKNGTDKAWVHAFARADDGEGPDFQCYSNVTNWAYNTTWASAKAIM